jgi:hypothetical protein
VLVVGSAIFQGGSVEAYRAEIDALRGEARKGRLRRR